MAVKEETRESVSLAEALDAFYRAGAAPGDPEETGNPAAPGGPEELERLEELLWETLLQYQDCPFCTAKQLQFTYRIRGNEMFVDRKDKSITRASVNLSFRRALELGGVVKGPKKLGTFGASYLYPVFRRIGVIREDISQN